MLTQKDAFGDIGLKKHRAFDEVLGQASRWPRLNRNTPNRNGKSPKYKLPSKSRGPRPIWTDREAAPVPMSSCSDAQLKAIVEAVIYVTDEPLSADQIATALQQPAARSRRGCSKN